MRSLLAGLAGWTGGSLPLRGSERWQRTSFTGDPVSLMGGVRAATGILIASAAAAPRIRRAALIAGTAGAVAGYIDDHRESRTATAKGLAGHLTMLKNGQVTTGALKIGIIGAGSAIAAGTLTSDRSRTGLCDWMVASTAIAGSANLINLLDLRPGRALKAVGLCSAVLAPGSRDARPLLAGTAGVIAGTAADDLAGETMLGDLGANALGAVVGTALAAHPSRAVRTGGAATIVLLILASERVSFSAVIAGNPVLSALDRWGR